MGSKNCTTCIWYNKREHVPCTDCIANGQYPYWRPAVNKKDVMPETKGVHQEKFYTMKLDKGKTDLTFLNYFKDALDQVCQLSEFGAKKYSRNGWNDVPDGHLRYSAAMLRHYFQDKGTGNLDDETKLAHDVAVAWNALARLQLRLDKEPENL